MAAYIVVQVDVKDPVRYDEYRKMVKPTLDSFGGRFLVRGGEVENLEGGWKPARFVIIEFDSAAQARVLVGLGGICACKGTPAGYDPY